MDPDKDNANPVILDASDLPTRRQNAVAKARVDGGTGLFDDLLPSTPFLNGAGYASSSADSSDGDDEVEEIDEQEIYEHPLSLGSLNVVQLQDIHILPPSSPGSQISTVHVEITPTITHCSLATVIGLGVRVRLEQALPPRFRVDVAVKPGTHSTADQVSKQLGDKERVAAALENGTLVGVLDKMLSTCT